MKYWQLNEQNKDVEIGTPSGSFDGVPSSFLLGGEDAIIKNIEISDNEFVKMKMVCVHKNDQLSEANFYVKGVTENGKKVVKDIFLKKELFLGKTVREFKEMDVIEV